MDKARNRFWSVPQPSTIRRDLDGVRKTMEQPTNDHEENRNGHIFALSITDRERAMAALEGAARPLAKTLRSIFPQ